MEKERLAVVEARLQQIIDGQNKIDIKLDKLDEIFATRREHKDLVRRVDRVESNQTWLWRTVIASVIGGAIGWIFYLAK